MLGEAQGKTEANEGFCDHLDEPGALFPASLSAISLVLIYKCAKLHFLKYYTVS